MKVKVIDDIAVVTAEEVLIKDEQSALDFAMTVNYQHDCSKIVINKEGICEEFFDLKTKIAGGIIQKYVNYDIKLAVIGDFSGYTSKSLKDFIFESNKGKFLFFAETEEEGLAKLNSK